MLLIVSMFRSQSLSNVLLMLRIWAQLIIIHTNFCAQMVC